MKTLKLVIILVVCLGCVFYILRHDRPTISQKSCFWNQTRKGANMFNQCILADDIKAAKAYGIAFIRLASDRFQTESRDFLIGNADNYIQLVQKDFDRLKHVLDMCANENMPIVLTMITLPGSRWTQHNHSKDDLRLWRNQKFQAQAAQFWRDLALKLKDHPAIVGYNILNEPHPERLFDSKSVHIDQVQQNDVQKRLFSFYEQVIHAIRSVDQKTPIILDSSAYGDPKTFQQFKIHKDSNVLYSFHMYEPYFYTNGKKNNGKFQYPGQVHNTYWNKEALRNYVQNVVHFQKVNRLPNHRILVGEFGCYRKSKGLVHYFHDLITIFKEYGWHFAFYAFREDVWDGMDYELGDKHLPWSYWKAIERGERPKLNRNGNSPQFKVLKEALL